LQSDLPPLSLCKPNRLLRESRPQEHRPRQNIARIESSNNGVARRNRRIFFACCGARGFTGTEARWQKSEGWGSSWSGCIVFTRCVARSWAESKRHSQESGDSNESFAVTWQILAWRAVQAEKFYGTQPSGREPCHREEHKY